MAAAQGAIKGGDGTTLLRAGNGKDGPILVARLPSAAGSVNATLVRAGPGRVHFINGLNAAAAVRYLKLYDTLIAPVVGTDTPFVTLAIPASVPFQFNLGGLFFTNGIGYGLVTGAADNSAVAVTAADILGLNITYE